MSEAERLAESAIALNPQYHDALILSARIAGRRGQADRAVGLLRRAVGAGADYADVHLILGDLLRDVNQAQAARRAYRRALELNNTLQPARDALATIQSDAATTSAFKGA